MRYAIAIMSGALLLGGCDTLECGEGTHRKGDVCGSNVQLKCAEGTVLRDGQCVAVVVDAGPDMARQPPGPDAVVVTCGEGTHREGNECVADVMPPDPDMGPPDPDDGVPPDMFIDPDDGVEPDMFVEPDAAELPPDMGAPPACPPELVPGATPDCAPPGGAYCITGVATNFLTGCALPADENLLAVVLDPTVVAGGGTVEDAARGLAPIGPNGTFTILAAGDAAQLVLTIDENPMAGGPNRWTRSVSGVSADQPTPGTVFPVRAFATDLETQGRWNALLGLGDGGLEQAGFLVGRVLQITADGPRPVAGAEVETRPVGNLHACAADTPCLRFFDNDPRLVGFQPAGATGTGASGAFLLIRRGPSPVFQAQFYVVGDDGFTPVPAGASVGSGFHTALVKAP